MEKVLALLLIVVPLSAMNDERLVEAVYRGTNEKVWALIQEGVDVNKTDGMGLTPLMLAAQAGLKAKAKMLLDAGAQVNKWAPFCGKITPLYLAVTNEKVEIAEMLLKAGANPLGTYTGLTSQGTYEDHDLVFWANDVGNQELYDLLVVWTNQG